ncbi:MAG: thiamine phosphate synthase [Deltaproteobacteria bacterium]|nr:thiamine phosphate synthase [Deltaproteobacteria bacterium]
MISQTDLLAALNLTLVISQQEARPRTIFELCELAFSGGVTTLQLREKSAYARDFYNLALQLVPFCRARERLFIINDRPDIALAVKADGVHLGQNDLPALAAREILPKSMILGVSVANLSQANEAIEAGADYLGLGAIISTDSKTEAEVIENSEIDAIIKTGALTVGIGGINLENCQKIRSFGFTGLAVISAIAGAQDPKMAAQILAGQK